MKINWWMAVIILIVTIIVAFVIFEFLNKSQSVLTQEDLTALFIFLVIVSGMIGLYYYYDQKKENLSDDILDIAQKVKTRWEEKRHEIIEFDEFGSGRTKTWEALNKTFTALHFTVSQTIHDVTDLLIIYDNFENKIRAFDYDPSPSKLKDPFSGFDPIEGRYKYPSESDVEVKVKTKKSKSDIDLGEEINESEDHE